MKCYLVSLGCPKNLVDSEVMLSLLSSKGHELVCSEEEAEAIIVNTCCFIESAKEEAINTILEMALMKENGVCRFLIVAGCLAQRYSGDLRKEIPEVDAFIGTSEIKSIGDVLDKLVSGSIVEQVSNPDVLWHSYVPRIVTTPFFYSYLKIAEGCSHKCSFCIIPQVRGRYKSRPFRDIIDEARFLGKSGVRELNLIAQDTSIYGKDINEDLVALLEELERIDEVKWIRLLYLYPASISDKLISFMGQSEKLCNYIDLPLQHCDGDILKLMGRKGNKEELGELIYKIRDNIPGVTLRTSIIVGFPGETDKQFASLMDFVEEMKFDRLGVFEYSREEDTGAALLKKQISKKIKKERLHKVMTLQKSISLEKNKLLAGSLQEVLVEEVMDDGSYKAVGRTRRDAPDIDGRFYFTSCRALPGDIVKASVTHGEEYDLIGYEL